jgi:hypothetical protein
MSNLSPQSGAQADIAQVTVTNRDFMSTRPSNSMILVPLLNPKFATALAA